MFDQEQGKYYSTNLGKTGAPAAPPAKEGG